MKQVEFLTVVEFKEQLNLQSLTIVTDRVKGTVFAKSIPEIATLVVKQDIDLTQELIVVAFGQGDYCIVNGTNRFEELSL